MDRLSYVALAAGVFSCIAAVQWSRGHLDMATPLAKGLGIAGATLIGYLCYVLVGFALALALPAHQAAIVGELRQELGLKIFMFAAVATSTFFPRRYRWRPKPKAIEPSPASVRERLLRARAAIEQRIEGLQNSPVLDYRGGIPQPDLIIEGLREKLSEIDEALSELPPSEQATVTPGIDEDTTAAANAAIADSRDGQNAGKPESSSRRRRSPSG